MDTIFVVSVLAETQRQLPMSFPLENNVGGFHRTENLEERVMKVLGMAIASSGLTRGRVSDKMNLLRHGREQIRQGEGGEGEAQRPNRRVRVAEDTCRRRAGNR